MFPTLISLLSGPARAAYGFIEGLAATSLSGNAILSQLAGAGINIRRQTGLDIIGVLRQAVGIQRFVRLFGPNVPIPASILPVSPTKLRKAIRYTVKTNTEHPELPGFINVSSDIPLTQEEIFGLAGESLDQYLLDLLGIAPGVAIPFLLQRGMINPNVPPDIFARLFPAGSGG